MRDETIDEEAGCAIYGAGKKGFVDGEGVVAVGDGARGSPSIGGVGIVCWTRLESGR